MNDIKISNYAAAFIDLLGQREELKGCGLLPDNTDELISRLKRTIGVTMDLHDQFEQFYNALTRQRIELHLPNTQQPTNLKFQRFSDGIVVYTSLAQDAEHSPIKGVFGLIAASGILCFLHLAQNTPLRAGLDIAWGAELYESELYGCVVARSYELECKVAKGPRVVVGDEVLRYLKDDSQLTGDGVNERIGREIASVCNEMITQDEDGQHIVDFLGSGFKKIVVSDNSQSAEFKKTYDEAKTYVEQQVVNWTNQHNEKLRQRYMSLDRYFEKNRFIWVE